MKWWTEECTVGVNWKSRNAAHPHSSNVFPKEGDFLDNKFSASEVKIDSEKSALTKDILEEYDHRMDFFEQTAEMYDSVLPYFSPELRLFCHQILGPGFEMLILTLLKMGLELLLNMKLVSLLKRIWGSIGALDAWDVYSSDNLNNYLTPRAMLSSRVDGTRVNGLIREIKDEDDQKKSFSASILPKHGKFFSTNESSRKAAVNNKYCDCS
uniref:Uncharacterized protein n=1 Tax=Solanum lycopersicum TaxID=4081 RepID=A0A3Q7FX77_SOLLC